MPPRPRPPRLAAVAPLALLLLLLALSEPVSSASPTNTTSARARALTALRTVLIADYMRLHKALRRTGPRLVYRLSLRQPGLGDRLTGLLYAYVLAALSGRVLLLDWRWPFALSDLLLANSGAALYYAPPDAALERARSVRHCLHRCPINDLTPFLQPHFTVVINRSHPLSVADIVKLARRHPHLPAARALLSRGALRRGAPYDRVPPDATLFGDLFKTMLRPSPTMLRFMRQYARPLMERRYVSVHVRLGTGVQEGGPRFERAIAWDRLAACLARRARAMAGRLGTGGTLFLATDTPAFRGAFRRAVVADGGSAQQVLYGTWGTKHIGRMEEDSETDLQLFRFALMELLLLGRGEGMVSTVSRYARIGAFVGGITEHEFVVPERDC